MKKLLFTLFTLVCLDYPAVIAKDIVLPGTLNYKLSLRIDYENEKIFGLCEITISNETEQPIKKIPILLYRLLTVKSVQSGESTPLIYSQEIVNIKGWEKLQVNYVEISLEQSLLPGNQTTIGITYEGYLLGYANEGWRYVKDHIGKDFTIIRTDGFDYPVIGLPDETNMMAIMRENYNYQVDITLPDYVIPVSGAELVNKVGSGKETTYTFRSKKPSWRLDVAIADYGMKVIGMNRIYYFKDDSASAGPMINDLEKSVELLTDWFGPLEDYRGYTIIEIPEGYSSQQDVTSFNITADNLRKPDGSLSVYHEVSHLWNVKPLELQPCRFESEGLAQFMEFLISEKLDKKKDAVSEAAQKYLNEIRNDFKEKTEYQDVPLKDYGIRDMTYYSYTLGMVVFSLLYDLAGQERFNQIIRSFYWTYLEKGASLDEFVNCCRKSLSSKGERFFNDWIYSTNAIKLILAGKSYDELINYYLGN